MINVLLIFTATMHTSLRNHKEIIKLPVIFVVMNTKSVLTLLNLIVVMLSTFLRSKNCFYIQMQSICTCKYCGCCDKHFLIFHTRQASLRLSKIFTTSDFLTPQNASFQSIITPTKLHHEFLIALSAKNLCL